MRDTIHLPGHKGTPACGLRGAMSCDVVGLRQTPLGTALSAATCPDVTCERCKAGGPSIRRRWMFWLSAFAAGRGIKAAPGCSYRIQV